MHTCFTLHCNRGTDLQEAVIDTIVAKVQGVAGDDRCVLLLGYQDDMETMMREANSGLDRRFQLSNAWNFPDYTDEQLCRILSAKALSAYGWDLGADEASTAVKVLARERRTASAGRFGNAGAVDNLLAAVAVRMEARTKHLAPGQRALLAAPLSVDFDPELADDGSKLDASAVFADLVGCKEVLEKLKEWQATISTSQRLGLDPLQNFELNFRSVLVRP